MFGVEHAADAFAELSIEPAIGNHPVLGRVRSSDQHGMAAGGEGVTRSVLRVRVPDTVIDEPFESIRTKSIAESRQHVAAQLIDRDLQHELRLLSRPGDLDSGRET